MAEATTLITDAELLAYGLPDDALSIVDVAVRDAARAASSATILSYFKKRFCLPIISCGEDTKRVVAHEAAYDLMTFRGFNPGADSGVLIVKRHDDAILWARDVARGIVEPVDLVDSTPDIDEAAPLTLSDDVAGWSWPTGPSDTDCGGGC